MEKCYKRFGGRNSPYWLTKQDLLWDKPMEYSLGRNCKRCGRTMNHFQKFFCCRCETILEIERQDFIADRSR